MAVAYQYCTGAVNCFASSGPASTLFSNPVVTTGSALYLGTCEQYPRVQGIKQFSPTYNDLAGPFPFDQQYFGDRKVIILDLTKFISSNVQALIDEGIISQSAIGSFVWQGGNSFVLWLQFSNFGTPVAIADLPAGEVYFNCKTPETAYDPIGTMNSKNRLIIEADKGYVAGLAQQWTYSTLTSYFSGLPTVA